MSYIDPKTVRLFDLVRDGKKVRFLFYRDKQFFYEQEDGFVFPISLEEANAGRATFLAEDKAIYFMRWMKKYIESVKNEEVKTSTPVSKLTPQEKSKGRSESYWDMSSEDKRLGILDWDGK